MSVALLVDVVPEAGAWVVKVRGEVQNRWRGREQGITAAERYAREAGGGEVLIRDAHDSIVERHQIPAG